MSTEQGNKINHRWHGIEEIISYFSLSADPTNRDAVMAELRRRLADQHPDQTGGAFSSEDHEATYHEIWAAINFLQGRHQSNSLTTVRSEDLALIRQALTALQQQIAIRQEHGTRREIFVEARSELRKLYRGPLITAGTALGCCTAVLVFIRTLKETPLFSFLLASPGKNVLRAAWVASGIMFLFLWIRERLTEREIRYLLTDTALLDCFRGACLAAHHNNRTFITGSDMLLHLPGERPAYRLRWFLSLRHLRHLRHFFLGQIFSINIDLTTREQIVEDYLARLLDRRIIAPSSKPDVARRYEVAPGIIETTLRGE